MPHIDWLSGLLIVASLMGAVVSAFCVVIIAQHHASHKG
jgi:hypothetical protein